jgi:flap endonuclease-1
MSQHVAVDYAGSQDFDSLLFGAPVLVRNITTTGRRKIPGKQRWMSISPERIELNDVLSTHGITREQLVEMALLMGTDFNEGIRGIGPKTALGLIKKHGCIEDVVATGKIEKISQLDELRRIFLEPSVTQEYQLIWKPTDDQAVVDYLSGEHQFDEGRVRSALEKFKRFDDGRRQKGLFDF